MGIPESLYRLPLPPIPESFLKELPKVAVRNGVPMFRIVNGQTETKFRNGKMDIKHLLQSGGIPCYVTVSKTRFRRKNYVTGEYKIYTSFDLAKRDKTKHLSFEIESATKEVRVGVGRPCWVIEVYVAPEEICHDTWFAQRYQMLEKNKIRQTIDVLGPYPKHGMYMACFDVIDDEGNAVAPSDRTIEECKRRWRVATGDTLTVENAIQASNEAMDAFEAKSLETMNENFYQWGGISATTRAKDGVMSKPIVHKPVATVQ
jgi:hypothetical protein